MQSAIQGATPGATKLTNSLLSTCKATVNLYEAVNGFVISVQNRNYNSENHIAKTAEEAAEIIKTFLTNL